MPDSSEQLTQRVDKLEQELLAAQSKISDLHKRNDIMDKRILETLTDIKRSVKRKA